MKTITCKLPEKLDAELEAAAQAQGVTKSAVVRQALEERMGRKGSKKAPRAYDLVADLLGSVKGPSDLLTNPKHMDDFGA